MDFSCMFILSVSELNLKHGNIDLQNKSFDNIVEA